MGTAQSLHDAVDSQQRTRWNSPADFDTGFATTDGPNTNYCYGNMNGYQNTINTEVWFSFTPPASAKIHSGWVVSQQIVLLSIGQNPRALKREPTTRSTTVLGNLDAQRHRRTNQSARATDSVRSRPGSGEQPVEAGNREASITKPS